jgi:hypothetical protein
VPNRQNFVSCGMTTKVVFDILTRGYSPPRVVSGPAKTVQDVEGAGLRCPTYTSVIMLGAGFDCQSQREKVPGAGACGQGVSNRTGAGWGGVNCASALCGVTVSAGTETDGLFGRSTVCHCCGLRACWSLLFDALFASALSIFPGGTLSVASENHVDTVPFNSSIEAHPARPRLADTTIETSDLIYFTASYPQTG